LSVLKNTGGLVSKVFW